MTRFGYRIFALLLCVVLTGPALLAQLGTATISGTVTDSSGAMVVGASVIAVSKETGFRRETVANNQGQYSMPGVVPGTYDVTFEFQGFKKSESRGLTLQVDQNARIDAVLEVGQVSESVEIKGQAPLIESQNASLGAVIDTEKILALPLNGRNFSQLALLVPGVTSGTGGFSANGLRSDQNAFQIDGTANSDSLQNGMAFQPNVDSVAEFKIQTSNYSAEFGKGAGAQVNIITKSGTKGFHGTLWEFLRHDKVQARRSTDSNSRSFPCNSSDPDITGRKACAPPFKQNQFGFTLGGPMFFIPKGASGERKTFYFVTYEGFRQVRGAATITQVPTVAQRNGDFTQNLLTTNAGTDALGRQWRRGQLFDPLSSRQVRDSAGNLRFVRDAFTGNIIPKTRFDPVAAKIVANTNFMPLPNAPGIAIANGNTNENWLDGRSNLSNSDEISNRVDHQFTPNDTVFGRFNFYDSNTYSPGSFVGFGTTNNTRNLNMTLSYTKVLTPSVINELRFGYTGRFSENGAEDGIAGTDWIGQFGIRGLSEARDSGILGSPSIAITGFAGLGNGTGPTTQRNYQFQPVEILSFNKGKHFMKVGGELRAARQNMVRPDAARGTFTFSTTNWTGIDGVANTGHTMSSFLLGLSAQKRRLVSDFLLQFRFAEWGAFFQDDYKATRNLTLNFGVRYMYYTPPYDARDAFSSFIRPLDCPNFASCSVVYNNFNPSNPNNPYFGLAGKDLPRSLTGTDKKNIGPRFGFAWQPFGSTKSVIRGGYGIFYDTVQTSINADSLWNYPQVVEDQQDLALGQNGLPSNEGFIGFAAETPALTKPVAAFAPGPNNFHHDFHNAYIQSWNFTIQRQLPNSMVIEVAYVGNKGTRLQRQENTNTAEPLGPRSEIPDLTNNAAIRSDVGVGRNQFRRLFPYAVAEGVIIPLSNSFEETSSAFSNYHGANIRFEKKQSGGLSFITTYTFGKAMSDSPGFGGGGSGQAGRIQNILNKKAEKGIADLNHKHRFTVASVWELPFGKGRRWGSNWNGLLDRIAGGWAIEGIITYQTGLPVTIYRAGDPASMGASAILRPDILKDCNPNIPGGEQTIARFFDTSCFAKPEQLISGDLRYGTAGRGTLLGPLTTGNDLSARKVIPITEKIRTEFRAEFFDAVNHAGFSVPTRDIDNGSFGRTTKTGDSRIIQFGLKLLF